MGDPKAFKSGREFAAWLGLVPRQTGTGGRVQLLGISKRGDKYLRTLLIHGARAVLTHGKSPPEWLTKLMQAPAEECGRRGDGEQDGTNDLGADGPRTGVSVWVRESACVRAAHHDRLTANRGRYAKRLRKDYNV